MGRGTKLNNDNTILMTIKYKQFQIYQNYTIIQFSQFDPNINFLILSYPTIKLSCANLVPTLPGGGALVVTRGGRNTESRCCPDAMERRRGDETKGSSLGPDGWGERMGSDGQGGGRRKVNCPREMCCCLVDDANWVTSQSATQNTLCTHEVRDDSP